MSWVRENTPEESIFVHWWDYGYWVQYGFGKPTDVNIAIQQVFVHITNIRIIRE